MVDGMIHEAGPSRLIITKTSRRYPYPIEVEDRKTGIRGRVDFNGARIVEVHDYGDQRGHFAVPLTTAHGRRYFLYWQFAGEFEEYRGLRSDLPTPAPKRTGNGE